MRRLGLISPYGWQAAQYYVQKINVEVRDRCGGMNSARIVLSCLNTQEVDSLLTADREIELRDLLIQTAQEVVAAGAEGLLICSLTMHAFADDIAEAVPVPVLHLLDSLETELARSKSRRSTLALLGPRAAMLPGPLRQRLEEPGRTLFLPSEEEARRLDDILYQQLCQGFVRDGARLELVEMIARLRGRKAGTIVLGCPELGTLLQAEDHRAYVFNAPELHALAAVDWMLGKQPVKRRTHNRVSLTASYAR